MMRLQNWQTKFAEFAQARAGMPFVWGSNDCCLFSVDAVLAMTGQDFGEGWRGAYMTGVSAMRRVAKTGGLSAIATDALGASVAPLMAAVGDVVLCTNEGRELLGICNGTTVLAAGENGSVILSMDAALAAWKV